MGDPAPMNLGDDRGQSREEAVVDPLVGAGIGLFIVPRTWRLLNEALHILRKRQTALGFGADRGRACHGHGRRSWKTMPAGAQDSASGDEVRSEDSKAFDGRTTDL